MFKVENDGVRFGLSALKGVGQGVIDAIIDERERNGAFKDFSDFISRCSNSVMHAALYCRAVYVAYAAVDKLFLLRHKRFFQCAKFQTYRRTYIFGCL